MSGFFRNFVRAIFILIGLVILFTVGYNFGVPNAIPKLNGYTFLTGNEPCVEQTALLPADETVLDEVPEEVVTTEEPPAIIEEEVEDDAPMPDEAEETGMVGMQTVERSNTEAPPIAKIKLRTDNGNAYISVEKLMYCSSFDKGVYIYYGEGETNKIFVKNITLTQVWNRLTTIPTEHFFKTKSSIINLRRVSSVESFNQDSTGNNYKYWVKMDDGNKLDLPKARYSELSSQIDALIF